MALGVTAAAMVIEAPKIERRIADEAVKALDGLGFSADVDGRDVSLVGIARDEDHRDQGLIRLAAISEIDVLRDHSVVAAPDSPFLFSATRMASGEIYLLGVLPDVETRTVLAEHFAAIGPLNDFTQIAGGAPDGWGERLVEAASALDALVQGTALVAGEDVTISGIYVESQSQEAFNRLSTPGWSVTVAADPRDALEKLRLETEALRADLRDAADVMEQRETDTAQQTASMLGDIETARQRIIELEAMLGGVDSPPAPQTTDENQ